MITIKNTGLHSKTEKWLTDKQKLKIREILQRYGSIGVKELAAATPVDTGKTAASWSYEIRVTKKGYSISWSNSEKEGKTPVVILLQYGHMANGSYVAGRDFINPTIRPILDKIANDIWTEVKIK